jgi:hypothetical protein
MHFIRTVVLLLVVVGIGCGSANDSNNQTPDEGSGKEDSATIVLDCPTSLDITVSAFTPVELTLLDSSNINYEDEFQRQAVIDQIDFINEFEGKINLVLVKRQGSGNWKRCIFEDASTGFIGKLTVSRKTQTFYLYKEFSRESDDYDTEILANEMQIIFSGSYNSANLFSTKTIENIPVKNFLAYYYSCGFIDCTYTDSKVADIGSFGTVTIEGPSQSQ